MHKAKQRTDPKRHATRIANLICQYKDISIPELVMLFADWVIRLPSNKTAVVIIAEARKVAPKERFRKVWTPNISATFIFSVIIRCTHLTRSIKFTPNET